MSQRLVLEVAYDGHGYSGFVPQTNAVTVGGLLDQALARIDSEKGKLTCSSRTDAGVHARQQIVSFTTQKDIKSRGWVLALAQLLPPDIVVVAAGRVPEEFDPRRDPLHKTYRYRVLQSQVADPFLFGRVLRIVERLDLEAMTQAASSLLGEHDFRAYRSARDTRDSAVRSLSRVSVEVSATDPRCVDIVVTGNRFLYNMVRIIAGTLVDVGRGKKLASCTREALISGQRGDLGMTAPAAGLCLERVELRTQIADRWPPLS